jgi:hypothetical protein
MNQYWVDFATGLPDHESTSASSNASGHDMLMLVSHKLGMWRLPSGVSLQKGMLMQEVVRLLDGLPIDIVAGRRRLRQALL